MSDDKDDPKDVPSARASASALVDGGGGGGGDDLGQDDHDHAPSGPVDPDLIARRQLLGKMSVALGAAGGLALGVPMAGFIVGPLFHPPPHDETRWKSVVQIFYWGETKELKGTGADNWVLGTKMDPPAPARAISANMMRPGDTIPVKFDDATVLAWAGVTGKSAAWLRKVSDTEFLAFSVNCAHLGCPVQWRPTAKLFMCPCHGGVYYADGTVAAGPPPHGLMRYPVRVKDGMVQISAEPMPIG